LEVIPGAAGGPVPPLPQKHVRPVSSFESSLRFGVILRGARHSIFPPRQLRRQPLARTKKNINKSQFFRIFPSTSTRRKPSTTSVDIDSTSKLYPHQHSKLCAYRYPQWLAERANQLAARVLVERLPRPTVPRSSRAILHVQVSR
jgi:hypothetical protein